MKKENKIRVIEMIKRELDIWKHAYPKDSNILNKFALKMICEVNLIK